MWRLATASDDEAIVSMCVALNAEDPGTNPGQFRHVRRTLAKLREEPNRDGSTLAPTIINLPSTPSPSIRLPIALPSGAVARITRAPPKANSSLATSCDLAVQIPLGTAVSHSEDPHAQREMVKSNLAVQSALFSLSVPTVSARSFENRRRGFAAAWVVELMFLDQFEEGESCFFGISAYLFHGKDEVSL